MDRKREARDDLAELCRRTGVDIDSLPDRPKRPTPVPISKTAAAIARNLVEDDIVF